jgi:hypothetical protein
MTLANTLRWPQQGIPMVTSLAKLQIYFCLFRLFRACLLATQANKSQQVLLIF